MAGIGGAPVPSDRYQLSQSEAYEIGYKEAFEDKKSNLEVTEIPAKEIRDALRMGREDGRGDRQFKNDAGWQKLFNLGEELKNDATYQRIMKSLKTVYG